MKHLLLLLNLLSLNSVFIIFLYVIDRDIWRRENERNCKAKKIQKILKEKLMKFPSGDKQIFIFFLKLPKRNLLPEFRSPAVGWSPHRKCQFESGECDFRRFSGRAGCSRDRGTCWSLADTLTTLPRR